MLRYGDVQGVRPLASRCCIRCKSPDGRGCFSKGIRSKRQRLDNPPELETRGFVWCLCGWGGEAPV